jgi:hypothetical protein
MLSIQYENPRCWVCGSTGYKVQASSTWPPRIVCRGHEYVCEHGKDPCEQCDSQ